MRLQQTHTLIIALNFQNHLAIVGVSERYCKKPRENRETNIIEQRLRSPTVTLILGSVIIGALVYLTFLLQSSFRGDPNMRGIIGNKASFGADKEFNDHHFHYGYFIYSAALLAKYDTEFLGKNEVFINLLVADITNYSSDEELPLRRSFDPYAGHSWASGTVPFDDGNNQESTSEAINAWIGAALWAKQTDNDGLALEASWMLSQEYATANRYWLMEKDKTPEYLKQYTSPIASIVWGGKREYATFFSNAPNAKLAIQLLPLSPTIRQLDTSLPESLFRGTSTKQPYGDSLLMAQPGATLKDAQQLPDQAIDDGNSRTYLYAYIASY